MVLFFSVILHGIISDEEETDGEKNKNPFEKIEALKKRLQKLPLKENVKSREEAVEILETSFQDALRKGYTLKELRALFTEEGVVLPLSLLKKRSTGKQEHSTRTITAATVRKETESSAVFTLKPDTLDEEL